MAIPWKMRPLEEPDRYFRIYREGRKNLQKYADR
jgi:hypothetical protein